MSFVVGRSWPSKRLWDSTGKWSSGFFLATVDLLDRIIQYGLESMTERVVGPVGTMVYFPCIRSISRYSNFHTSHRTLSSPHEWYLSMVDEGTRFLPCYSFLVDHEHRGDYGISRVSGAPGVFFWRLRICLTVSSNTARRTCRPWWRISVFLHEAKVELLFNRLISALLGSSTRSTGLGWRGGIKTSKKDT